jgi:hypothetical protein
MNHLLRLFLLTLFLHLLTSAVTFGQATNEATIRRFYDEALLRGKTYAWLDYLSNQIGGRLSGSPQAAAAVEWSRQVMDTLGFDRVFVQEVMVPHWIRGEKEVATIRSSRSVGDQPVSICALGGSVPTSKLGILAEVVEVKNFQELDKLGKKGVEGKIVFFNRPMDATQLSTFDAYRGAVDQRAKGPSEAVRYGAVAVIVRSMTLSLDDYPHTGGVRYDTTLRKIPAAAISTKGAELLSSVLKNEPKVQLYLRLNCQTLPDVKSYNVIGEIKGSTYPDEIVAVGGHLDSWDTGDGAHDDGAGCVQAIEALRLFKVLGIRPKRTIRAVLFMNEENGVRGGQKYAQLAQQNNEKNIAAIESDRGGFTPKEFFVEGNNSQALPKVIAWQKLFEPYGLTGIRQGESGTDIQPLKPLGTTLIGYVPDSQRYFDYHHTSIDTFDKVNKRELELGAAAMASLVYLLSEYGL